MTIEASFIIPTYHRPEALDVSIPLFLAQDTGPGSFEVVVISDGPDPEAEAIAARHADPALIFEALAENAGPAAARNRAIARASGRILVFVDDDSLVMPDFLRRHLALHAGRDDRLVTGPIIDVMEPPDMAAPPPVRLSHRHMNPFPTCNASVAKSRVVDAGGFDEGFRKYGWEDPEMYWRLRREKLDQVYENGVPIYHLKPQNREKAFSAQIRREFERGANGAVFYAKHPDFSVGLQTKQLGIFHALDRLCAAVFGLERKMRRVLDQDWTPTSAFTRKLLLLHAEISAGRGAGRDEPRWR